MSASLITICKRMKPLYQMDSSHFLTYRSGYLYLADIKEKYYERIVRIHTRWNTFFAFSRLLERILRLEPRTAQCVARDIFVLPCKGNLYRVDIKNKTINKELSFTRGMTCPLSIAKIENIKGFDDCVAFGEYLANEEQKEVAIYARRLGRQAQWRRVFEFEKGKINHIHALIPDPYRGCILILTGDTDQASGIWIAENNFKDVTPLLVGNQQYRSCAAFPEKDRITYFTDTPLEKNHAYQLEICEDQVQLKKCCELPGPCICSLNVKGNYVISTTVEPNPRQSRLKYLFTREIGAGISCNKSFILKGSWHGQFLTVCSIQKDLFPMGLCQLGTVQFPVNGDGLFGYLSAVGKDGSWIKIEEDARCMSLH